MNTQRRRGEFEHSPSSWLPRCLYGFSALISSLTSSDILSVSLSPISHVHKPTLNFYLEREAFSLLTFLHESSSLRSRGQAGQMQGEARRSPARSVWAVLWKLDTVSPLLEKQLVGCCADFTTRSAQMDYCLMNPYTAAPGITLACAWRWKNAWPFSHIAFFGVVYVSATDDVLDVFPRTDHLLRFSVPCVCATWLLLNVMKRSQADKHSVQCLL